MAGGQSRQSEMRNCSQSIGPLLPVTGTREERPDWQMMYRCYPSDKEKTKLKTRMDTASSTDIACHAAIIR